MPATARRTHSAATAGQHPRQPDTRITEAQREGWTGEAEGLKISLAATEQKLAQLDNLAARRSTIHLGLPSFPDIAGRASTPANTSPP